MPEMHQQVNNLRVAFSADTTKPFELKPSFPFGSPHVAAQTSPASNPGSYRPRLPSQHSPLDHPGQINYHTHPITPPMSATENDTKADSPVAQSLVMMASGQRAPQPSAGMQMQEPVQWNPQRIFELVCSSLSRFVHVQLTQSLDNGIPLSVRLLLAQMRSPRRR